MAPPMMRCALGIEDQLGETVVGAVGDGATRPPGTGRLDLASFLLGLSSVVPTHATSGWV